MESRLPLSALLSQVLVAFVIEFDNEFERQVPHRTTNHSSGARSDPWLVSMTMWLKFMRFLPDNGISTAELQRLTGLHDKEFGMWLNRLGKWWGYVKVSGGAVRPASGGLKALAAWRPLTGVIERRWEERFGKDTIDGLRETMQPLVEKFCDGYPDYLPILGYDLLSKGLDRAAVGESRASTLPMLLSKILLAFAIEFERDSSLSLAICANALRLTGKQGVRVRDLPRLSGVSKEAVAMLMGRVEERGLGIVQPESPGSRVKLLVLTAAGQLARDSYRRLARDIERLWKKSLGDGHVEKLRELLERLATVPAAGPSPLFGGLQPYPEGWRAQVPKRECLPHYPMVLHRGGFPDGS